MRSSKSPRYFVPALVFKQLRHLAVCYFKSKPLSNSGFTYARLAYKARIVFSAPAEYLNYTLNFSGPAYNGVDFAVSRFGS